jgi:hypothetical protein
MNRVRAGVEGGLEQPVDAQVALGWRRGADLDGAIGGAHVRGGAVGGRVDGHRLEPFLMTCPDDAERDFPAVGDEHPPHGWQAGGGVSPKRRRRLLQRSRLWVAARS